MPNISQCYFCTLHYTSLFPPHPWLTIQSEAGGDFLGVAAQPIVARLLPQCAPLPHLYTVLSVGAVTLSPAHQLFRLLPGHMHACMRARTTTLTYTHRKVLMHRVELQEQPSTVLK